jgi:MYXO-CTERM domain-containing protein
MRRRCSIIAVSIFLLAVHSATAFAWEFTCSPKEITEILPVTPRAMLMLDRSGSMDWGEVPRSCKVCEDASGYHEVMSAADCPGGGTPWSVYDESTYDDSVGSGYTHTFSFTSLPATVHDLELELAIKADINGTCEWADLYVDGDLLYEVDSLSQCNRRVRTFTIPQAYAADGQIDIEFRTSPDGNGCRANGAGCISDGDCDGVDAFCGENYVEATLSHDPPVYHGTQAWSDPCGTKNKWEQAIDSIDALTFEAQNASPETAHFGLGLYHGSNASIEVDCGASKHGEIMGVLGPYTTGESCPSGSTCPGGSTPTALAIQTSRNSDCVSGVGGTEADVDVQTTPQNGSVSGYDHMHTLTGISTTDDIVVRLELQGDYGHSCEFATVYIDGTNYGTVTGTECGTLVRNYTVPAADVADGEVEVFIDTRADGEPIGGCGTGDGTDAYCGTNRSRVTAIIPPPVKAPTATILINDGAPTVGLNGGARESAIREACEHRDTAMLYVVGLGGDTDEDYNNILAAAGGTGSCTQGGMPVDPCDDSPSNWSDYRNDCEGSIQAADEDALLAALVDITSALACTFPINFFNSGYTQVPEDPSNEYEYMYVEVYNTDTGEYERIFHKDSSSAMPPGEGWDFSSDSRTFVEFTAGHCDQVQAITYNEASTQLACLCQEVAGTRCDVDNWEANGTCPEGTWVCDEGTDICEPDAECCIPGLPCDTGELGVCADGEIVCDGSPMGVCERITDPSEEICDGLDNDCDGEVDEISGSCTVPNTSGRCSDGVRQCDGNMEVCVPLDDPMPELCNGLDDDCNGVVDDISESWEDPQFSGYSLSPDDEGKACRYLSVCMCDGAADDIAGDTFQEYVDAWDPVCQCGEGLAPDSTSSKTDGASPRVDDEPLPASCSAATGDGAPASLWLLAIAGGLVLRRRRR